MTAPLFVDTNVLIYAHDVRAAERHDIAKALILELWRTQRGVLSTQVLQEFYVNVTHKIRRPLHRVRAREVIRTYALWVEEPITASTVVRASELEELAQLSFWDSLIVASALENNCSILYTEDMQDGQVFEGRLTVVNPFKG